MLKIRVCFRAWFNRTIYTTTLVSAKISPIDWVEIEKRRQTRKVIFNLVVFFAPSQSNDRNLSTLHDVTFHPPPARFTSQLLVVIQGTKVNGSHTIYNFNARLYYQLYFHPNFPCHRNDATALENVELKDRWRSLGVKGRLNNTGPRINVNYCLFFARP